jgi:hypothetical protein
MKVALLKMDGGDPLLAVPKLGLTPDEVMFCVGSQKVYREMVRRGFLVPANRGPLLYDAGDVRRAWEEWKRDQAKMGRGAE